MQIQPEAQPLSHDASGDGARVGVLISHGFTGSPFSMRPIAERCVEQGWSVRMPLLPGHGTRWQDMNRTGWADWYQAIETSFDELRERCEVVVGVGLSMGGSLVTRLAELRGDEIAGLVLINPAYQMSDPRLRVLPVMKYALPSLKAIGNDIKKPGVTEHAYPRTPLKALHSALAGWAETAGGLDQVTQPILLLHSAEDHVVDPSNSALLLERVSSADVTEIVLEDSYHVATLDNDADAILKSTVAFIERLAGASS